MILLRFEYPVHYWNFHSPTTLTPLVYFSTYIIQCHFLNIGQNLVSFYCRTLLMRCLEKMRERSWKNLFMGRGEGEKREGLKHQAIKQTSLQLVINHHHHHLIHLHSFLAKVRLTYCMGRSCVGASECSGEPELSFEHQCLQQATCNVH